MTTLTIDTSIRDLHAPGVQPARPDLSTAGTVLDHDHPIPPLHGVDTPYGAGPQTGVMYA